MSNKKHRKSEEELIQEFAELSKGLRTPSGLRASNRRRIEGVLRTAKAEKTTSGWFRRRISVPLPVAAGFLLIFFLQLTLQFCSIASHIRTSKEVTSETTNSTALVEEPLQLHYSEQNVYVAGMGFVDKLRNYDYSRENNYESN